MDSVVERYAMLTVQHLAVAINTLPLGRNFPARPELYTLVTVSFLLTAPSEPAPTSWPPSKDMAAPARNVTPY